MPVKKNVYLKYAIRLIADLRELHDLLLGMAKMATHPGVGARLSSMLDRQERLSYRITIQREFLQLVTVQFPPNAVECKLIEDELHILCNNISTLASVTQTLFTQKRLELRQNLDSHQQTFHGQKKSLCRNYSTPSILDISL